MNKGLYLLLAITPLFVSCLTIEPRPIEDASFTFADPQGVYELEGFVRFVDYEFTLDVPADALVAVPKNRGVGFGYGTYQFDLSGLDPRVAYAIKPGRIGVATRWFADGEEFHSTGVIGTERNLVRPEWNNHVIPLPPGKESMTLTIQVANFLNGTSGIVNPMVVGPVGKVNAHRTERVAFEFFIFGSLLIMALYHTILAFYRRNDSTFIYLAILCWILGFRGLVQGELFVYDLLPGFPWHLQLALGYLTFTLGVGTFVSYVLSLYKERSFGWEWIPLWVTCGGFSAVVLFAPVSFYSRFLGWFQIATLVFGAYAILVIARAVFHRDHGAVSIILGLVLIFSTVVHDILISMGVFTGRQDLGSFGMVLFFLFQSVLLARRVSDALKAAEEHSAYLVKINDAMDRFVPNEILGYLEKKDITSVELGDHREMEMAVLFADIRSFTNLSEKMTPDENFRFINSYLARMGPIIRNHHGFVDKFMGDGIMALFPRRPEDALNAALAMRDALGLYNRHRSRLGYDAINIGIGIHQGPLMMGTIGEHRRMDSTVISDTVNLASRLEEHTKEINVDLLISGEFLESLEVTESMDPRHVGTVRVKGRDNPVAIYTVSAGT
jgi:adenylate cyclase